MGSESSQSVSDVDATVAGTGGSPTAAHDALAFEPGQHLGRYVLLEEVGRGAAGRVFAAFDEELDRRIALKLVTGPEKALAPAKQEAQAMAKVSHPHVVVVHDVGAFDGGVFIAMEYLRGGTLADRMARKRQVRDILHDFMAAGQGLAAAHGAGLVHRDFKPTNVLFDAEGRAKVADFGLAISSESGETARRLVGTPAYMAPEQFGHQGVDARTDQFSFCVTLHEALWGVRPFDGQTLMELAASVLDGTLVDVPRGGVPPRVRKAVLRALSPSPNDRFPTMDALLRELDPDRRARAARRTVVFGLAGVTLVSAWSLSRPNASTLNCEAAANEIDDVWSPDVAASLRARALASTPDVDPVYLDRAMQSLDEHARSWASASRRTCQLAATDPSTVDEPRQLCLYRSRTSLSVFVEAALEDPSVLLDIDVLRGLRDPQECLTQPAVAGLDALLSDPETSSEVFDAAALAERSNVHQLVGRLAEAAAVGDRAIAAAEALHSPYLIGRAQLARGRSALSGAHTDDAHVLLSKAFENALIANDPETSALAAERLVDVYIRRGDGEECEHWYGIAAAMQTRLGNPPGMRASLATNSWDCPFLAGDPARAEAMLRDALPFAADDGQRGDLLFNLASLEAQRENFDEALPLIEEVAAAWGDRYPATHRRSLALMRWRVLKAEREGRLDEALALLEEQADIKARSRGQDHPEATYDETGVVLYAAALGQLAKARRKLDAVRGRVEDEGEQSTPLDRALVALATAAIAEATGDFEDAEAVYVRALDDLPPDESWLRPQLDLGRTRALVLSGRLTEAQDQVGSPPADPDAIAWQQVCWLAVAGDRRPSTLASLAGRKHQGSVMTDKWALCQVVNAWVRGDSTPTERAAAVERFRANRPGMEAEATFLARQLDVELTR